MTDQWLQVQGLLRDRGYGLGSSGPNHDGVDGNPGELTAAAVLAELLKGQVDHAGIAVLHDGSYDRAAMRAELVRDEGERLKAYKDTVGKWTIGVGRNLDDVGISADESRALGITTASALANGITHEQSARLLDSDLNRVDADLDRRLPWWRKLDPVRQRVLVNMAFNLGIQGLCGFTNTLKMMERGDYAMAADTMLMSKWARQVGARAQRLSGMMRTGA